MNFTSYLHEFSAEGLKPSIIHSVDNNPECYALKLSNTKWYVSYGVWADYVPSEVAAIRRLAELERGGIAKFVRKQAIGKGLSYD